MAYDTYVTDSLEQAGQIEMAMQYYYLMPVSLPLDVNTISDIDSKHDGTCLERLKYLSDTGAFEMCSALLNRILSDHFANVNGYGSDKDEDDDDGCFHGAAYAEAPVQAEARLSGEVIDHFINAINNGDNNRGPIVSAPPPSPRAGDEKHDGDEDHALDDSIGDGIGSGSVDVTPLGLSEKEKRVRQLCALDRRASKSPNLRRF